MGFYKLGRRKRKASGGRGEGGRFLERKFCFFERGFLAPAVGKGEVFSARKGGKKLRDRGRGKAGASAGGTPAGELLGGGEVKSHDVRQKRHHFFGKGKRCRL